MHYRKHIRLPNYDYSRNGYYFVTICTTNRFPLLGNYKNMLKQELFNLEKRFLGIRVDFNEIMPTHIHFILYFEEVKVALSRVIQAYKSITTLKVKQEAKQASQLQNTSVAAELALPNIAKLWQPNYYEHVIRNELALNKIREYIMNNPDKEKYDWDRLDVKP